MRSGKAPEILVGRSEDGGEHEHDDDEHAPRVTPRTAPAVDSRSDRLLIVARRESAYQRIAPSTFAAIGS